MARSLDPNRIEDLAQAGFRAFAAKGFRRTQMADVARELNQRHFYCDHRPGAGVRISPHFYNKDEEIELFFEEIAVIRKGGSR